MTVYLVGAGPGDPGLLTRKGYDLLCRADVVVHDRLGTSELLPFVRADAMLIDVGKAPGRAAMTQDQINTTLVEQGRAHECVVRLKGGDPFVFGRGGEEIVELQRAQITYEVVPGITSAISAAAYAGIPVTHRGVATHFTVVTGHEDPTKPGSDTDWDAIARLTGTIVILMGAAHIAEIAERLIAGGKLPTTPVAAVRWGTTSEQRTIRTTLAEAANAGIASPSAIIVGEVAALDFGWFEQRPLFGKRVVVTRAREQASELTARLTALGAQVIELPAIAISPLPFTVPDFGGLEWLVFTSANGVQHFMHDGLSASGRDTRALHGIKIAAIGPGTADALARFGIVADLIPERFIAESLLEVFPAPQMSSARAVVVRPLVARDTLIEGLREHGYTVEPLATYETVRGEVSQQVLDDVRTGKIDIATFTSSSTVANFFDVVGNLDPTTKVVSIGPQTSLSLTQRGQHIDVEANPHNIDGLVQAVVTAAAASNDI